MARKNRSSGAQASKPKATRKDKMQDKVIRDLKKDVKNLKNNLLKYHDVIGGGFMPKTAAAPLVVTLTNVPSEDNAGVLDISSRSDRNITGLKFKVKLTFTRYRSAVDTTLPTDTPYTIRALIIRRPITAGGTPAYSSVMQGNAVLASRHFDHHESSVIVWDKLFQLSKMESAACIKTYKFDLRIPKSASLIGFDANSDPPVSGDTVSNHYYLLLASNDNNADADGNSDMLFSHNIRLLFED